MYRSAEHVQPSTGEDLLIARYASAVYARFNLGTEFDVLPEYMDTMARDGVMEVIRADVSPNVTAPRFVFDALVECRIAELDRSDPTIIFRSRSKIKRDYDADTVSLDSVGVDVSLGGRYERRPKNKHGKPIIQHVPYDIARIRFEDSKRNGVVTKVLANGTETKIPFAVPSRELIVMRNRVIHLAQSFQPRG